MWCFLIPLLNTWWGCSCTVFLELHKTLLQYYIYTIWSVLLFISLYNQNTNLICIIWILYPPCLWAENLPLSCLPTKPCCLVNSFCKVTRKHTISLGLTKHPCPWDYEHSISIQGGFCPFCTQTHHHLLILTHTINPKPDKFSASLAHNQFRQADHRNISSWVLSLNSF